MSAANAGKQVPLGRLVFAVKRVTRVRQANAGRKASEVRRVRQANAGRKATPEGLVR